MTEKYAQKTVCVILRTASLTADLRTASLTADEGSLIVETLPRHMIEILRRSTRWSMAQNDERMRFSRRFAPQNDKWSESGQGD